MEFGIIYNQKKTPIFNYWFCSYQYNKNLFISDALNNRVIIKNLITNSITYISKKDWFPRCIQPYKTNAFFYLDTKKKKLGYVQNNEFIKECTVPMEKTISLKLTSNNTLLVGGNGKFSVLEFTLDFNIIGQYLDDSFHIQSIDCVDENFLICDSNKHQVIICKKDGKKLWDYGKLYHPGELKSELSTPKFACIDNDLIFIADGKNNRILCVNKEKKIKFIFSRNSIDDTLWWPSCLQKIDDKLLITDSGNSRIIELSLNDFSLKVHGHANIQDFLLNNPRGIEIINNKFLLTDTYNHRILLFDENLSPQHFYGGKRGVAPPNLFWPRAIRMASKNIFWIADSRNSRILKIDDKNNIQQIIYGYNYNNNFYKFIDPHDIDIYEDKILVTDSSLGKIIELNSFGECSWIYGINNELNDPHHARKTMDNNILISDTRNNRIIKVSYQNKILREIKETDKGNLKLPRWCEEIGENLLVTDSGNNRVILLNKNNKVLKEYGSSNSKNLNIRAPRCARKFNNYVLISDTYNNRILLEDF